MLKPLALTLVGALTTTTLPAVAIAPGFTQIRACSSFTANQYRIAPEQIQLGVAKRSPLGYYIDWRVSQYGSSGYCFVTNQNATTRWVVERGPRPGQVAVRPGPNEKIFYNLPIYGNVIINRGQGAIGDKQYFLLRPISTGRNYKWYARCGNNSDQVYDQNGKYVGYDQRLTVMFPYVCEVSPLSRPNRPPVRPQPR